MSNVSVRAPGLPTTSTSLERFLLPLAGVGLGALIAAVILAIVAVHYTVELDTPFDLALRERGLGEPLLLIAIVAAIGLPLLFGALGFMRSSMNVNPVTAPGRSTLAYILATFAVGYGVTLILFLLNASAALQLGVLLLSLAAGLVMGLMRLEGDTRQEWVAGFIFIAPAVLILLIFVIIPILFALYVSLRDWDGLSPVLNSDYIGTENYARLLVDDGIKQRNFFLALKNTIYYTLGVVPLQTAIALVLATIASQRWLRGRNLLRTAFYFPSITSSIVVSIIFLWLFQRNGVINRGLDAVLPGFEPVTWMGNSDGVLHNLLGLFGISPDTSSPAIKGILDTEIAGLDIWNWLSGPSVTLLAIMILNVWTTIGTMMLIFLAALQNIPTSLYEAASVDGATARQQFFRMTIPMLRPTLYFVITIGLIGCLQVFDQIYVIGGDRTTMSVAYRVYQSGFEDSDMSLATATAFILFVIIFIFTMIQRRITGDKAA